MYIYYKLGNIRVNSDTIAYTYTLLAITMVTGFLHSLLRLIEGLSLKAY